MCVKGGKGGGEQREGKEGKEMGNIGHLPLWGNNALMQTLTQGSFSSRITLGVWASTQEFGDTPFITMTSFNNL